MYRFPKKSFILCETYKIPNHLVRPPKKIIPDQQNNIIPTKFGRWPNIKGTTRCSKRYFSVCIQHLFPKVVANKMNNKYVFVGMVAMTGCSLICFGPVFVFYYAIVKQIIF
ncbi:MAG: hypothetical protein Satyrvirus1_38 [Satyrvirus sp.]|uniref:Uncharacterized protein n=1 Tax=Satyrvirus sp. TaxID=2487771 RepID=A0A3G5ACR9_9VIRU|nr:MAG: hypothetical protein Satyrvirus1_38 [Satyrvirus sp.]